MNRVVDLFGRKLSIDPVRTTNKQVIIDGLGLGELTKVPLPLDTPFDFDYHATKYRITNKGKYYTVADARNKIDIVPNNDCEYLSDFVVSKLIKYDNQIFKVESDNHPGYESTNLYYCGFGTIDLTDLIELLKYITSGDMKLYRSFKMRYNDFLKLASIPEEVKFENPKIISSLELNIVELIKKLSDDCKQSIKSYAEFIGGIFLDNRAQVIYEILKNKKPIEKISLIVGDNGEVNIIDGTHRLAVLWALGYEMIDALVYGDLKKLVG